MAIPLALILSAASSAYGAAAKSQSAKRQDNARRARQSRLNAWYDREYNSNPLDRVSNRAILEKARQEAARLYSRQAGAAAVTGATPEAQAASKAAIANAYANGQTNIAAAETARRDRVQETYNRQSDALDNERISNEDARQDAINTGLQGIANVLSKAYESGLDTKSGTGTKSDTGTTSDTSSADDTGKELPANEYLLDQMGTKSTTSASGKWYNPFRRRTK